MSSVDLLATIPASADDGEGEERPTLSPRLHPVQPQRPLAKGMGLTSAIEKDTVGLSLRLRGGGAPDSKGKGACTQQRRTPA